MVVGDLEKGLPSFSLIGGSPEHVLTLPGKCMNAHIKLHPLAQTMHLEWKFAIPRYSVNQTFP